MLQNAGQKKSERKNINMGMTRKMIKTSCQTDVFIKISDRLIETDWDDTRTLLYHQHSVVTS